MKALEELWFPPDDMLKYADDRTKVVAYLPAILSVVGNRERQTNIQDFLHKVSHGACGIIMCLYAFQIVADKTEKEATVLVEQYTRICDTLIDMLVDGQELPGFVSRARPFRAFLIISSVSPQLYQNCASLCRCETVDYFKRQGCHIASLLETCYQCTHALSGFRVIL